MSRVILRMPRASPGLECHLDHVFPHNHRGPQGDGRRLSTADAPPSLLTPHLYVQRQERRWGVKRRGGASAHVSPHKGTNGADLGDD